MRNKHTSLMLHQGCKKGLLHVQASQCIDINQCTQIPVSPHVFGLLLWGSEKPTILALITI